MLFIAKSVNFLCAKLYAYWCQQNRAIADRKAGCFGCKIWHLYYTCHRDAQRSAVLTWYADKLW